MRAFAHARRRRPGPPGPFLAVAAFIATLAILHGHGSKRPLDPAAIALAVLACVPLLAPCRRNTLAAFALSAAASAALGVIGYRASVPIAAGLALAFVAGDPRTRNRLPLTAAVVLGMLAVFLVAVSIGQHRVTGASVFGPAVLWAGAWIAGEQTRQRRQRIADFRERAAQAQRETDREQRLAVAEERNRIARDLHDSAAHAINVILVQAGAARLLQDRDPQAVRTALETIEDVARETIGEIDGIIRGLRERSDGDIEPPTGLAAVRTLADRHHAGGLETEIEIEGQERQLAPALDQAGYRILQESLTNAARYGNGKADVRIGYGPERLELTVSNEISPQPAQGGGGHGILGMRERAELLGGTLVAGPHGEVFVVRATLPY